LDRWARQAFAHQKTPDVDGFLSGVDEIGQTSGGVRIWRFGGFSLRPAVL
jgi:hypothetical protein